MNNSMGRTDLPCALCSARVVYRFPRSKMLQFIRWQLVVSQLIAADIRNIPFDNRSQFICAFFSTQNRLFPSNRFSTIKMMPNSQSGRTHRSTIIFVIFYFNSMKCKWERARAEDASKKQRPMGFLVVRALKSKVECRSTFVMFIHLTPD